MHKRRKTFRVHASSCKPTKKCAMKIKQRNKQEKKQHVHKNVIDGRKPFIGHIRKTGENDLDKLQVNDSGHTEGTICLMNG